jgi:hypothetical protein
MVLAMVNKDFWVAHLESHMVVISMVGINDMANVFMVARCHVPQN